MGKPKMVRLGNKPQFSLFRPILYLIAIIATTFFSWLFLEEPKETITSQKLVESQGFEDQVQEFVFKDGELPIAFSPKEMTLAQFGRRLFFDTRLSSDGKVACATCHKPEAGFTDGIRFSHGVGITSRNSPTIINSAANFWFFWDGRADSLASQAIGPIENPDEHGISRAFVVNFIFKNYKKEYEASFGKWPKALKSNIPENALPRPRSLTIPIEISAYGLQTIAVFSELEKILESSSKKHIAPAEELSNVLTAPGKIDESWYLAWESLNEKKRIAINQVYGNFGVAIEAFEKGIIAKDSPFDRFAKKLAVGVGTENSLNPGFGLQELAGLKIFLGKGNCTSCHIGPTFSDQQFHNTGFKGRSGPGEASTDIGRSLGVMKTTTDEFNCLGEVFEGPRFSSRKDLESCKEMPWLTIDNLELVGAFKTPTLRNVAQTGPYGHDGRFADLREVLDHYNQMNKKPAIGHREDTLQPLGLEPSELDSLEMFLKSLTSKIYDVSAGQFIDQDPQKKI